MADIHVVTPDAYYLGAYLRVAAISVASYDFLETLPTTRRFYRQQWRERRLTTSGVLFFLIQASSILAITISNIGFFYKGFSDASCRHFYFIPPIFKVVQLMVSQAILGIRVFNLSRRSVKMGVILVVLFFAAGILEWVTNLYGRISVYDPTWGNCRGIPTVGGNLGTWICYVVAIVYDLCVTSISVVYLLHHRLSASTSVMTRLTKMMIYDGLFYFVVLTGVNIFNLILYRSTEDLRTDASSLCFCMTWIMSQRLLIHLHNASLNRRNESINQAVTMAQTIESYRQTSETHPQFERKSALDFELTIPDFDLTSFERATQMQEDIGLEVSVERTHMVDHLSGNLESSARTRNRR